jgi:RecB family exonuclease
MPTYNPPRTRNLFQAGSPFSFSRTKVDSFIKCPRCFYLDRVHGIEPPPIFPYTLNNAVDTLMKKEFDHYRMLQQVHPLIAAHGHDFIPFKHIQMDEWRNNFKGARAKYKGFEFSGAIDDVWQQSNGELIIVDYKATAKNEPVMVLNNDYHEGYKRQMEFYQWLFRKMGFNVAKQGYFVYCTGDTSREAFNAELKFNIELIAYEGNNAWIEPTLDNLIDCLHAEVLPKPGEDCNMCKYVKERSNLFRATK